VAPDLRRVVASQFLGVLLKPLAQPQRGIGNVDGAMDMLAGELTEITL
jgi:hypothetical protein